MSRNARKRQGDATAKCVTNDTFGLLAPFAQTRSGAAPCWHTALYARLSRERTQHEAMDVQIEVVRQHIANSGGEFCLIDVYADDGYSGTTFDRPAFSRLMEDIRSNKINCIICKDLSRFAREHIGAGDYLYNIFPFLGVRFIALADNYDSLKVEPEEQFIASFKNLANAHYAKETSRKCCQAKRTLMEQGKFIGSQAPFGYEKDPSDKHKLVINEAEAEIVREVYSRAVNGETPADIARAINSREPPSERDWVLPRVSYMLHKEVYKGTLVQHVNARAFYKDEESHTVPKAEQIRFENAVPAIVSPELWEKVQLVLAENNPRKRKEVTE